MLRVYVYRPDKALYENDDIRKENLYDASGKKYTPPRIKEKKHPMEIIHKHTIGSSYIEVER